MKCKSCAAVSRIQCEHNRVASPKLFMRSKYDANGRERFIPHFNGNFDLYVTSTRGAAAHASAIMGDSEKKDSSESE